LPSWVEAQSGVVEILGNRIQQLTEDLNQLEKLEINSGGSHQLE
jgi:hypothetical protein